MYKQIYYNRLEPASIYYKVLSEYGKAIETAKKVMSRRSIKMSSHYENMLIEVFDMTSSFRS